MGIGMDLYARRSDGSQFPVDIMLSPMHAENGMLVLSVVRDITRRKQNEQKILELNGQLQGRVDELQTANQSLEAFSYSISHDLRAPLRAIDGFSCILAQDYSADLDQEAQRLLNVISANCHKMGQLIEDLLAFSRVSRHEVLRSEIDMTALARSVVDDLRALEPSRQIEIKLHPLPLALGERAMVRQVLVNLISNAWKFTRCAPRPVIEIGSYRDGDAHVYFVQDNGVGFDPQYSDKLFGVFERLHSGDEFEGSGIGLAVVRRIVRRHGGEAWGTGKVHEGARFCFTLAKSQVAPVPQPVFAGRDDNYGH
jgi:light-regulated signal transduction histidine kinase (bacteriophytochrome)